METCPTPGGGPGRQKEAGATTLRAVALLPPHKTLNAKALRGIMSGTVGFVQKGGWRMDELLTVQVPAEVQRMLNRTREEMERDIRLYAALMLFQQGKLSSGAAAAMAGIPRVMFLDVCAENDIVVSDISPEALRREMHCCE